MNQILSLSSKDCLFIRYFLFLCRCCRSAASFNKLLATPSMEGPSIFSLVDANNGEVKFAQRHLALVPASVLKLVTSATALEILEATTFLQPHCTIREGLIKIAACLDGDIIISGGEINVGFGGSPNIMEICWTSKQQA